MKEQHPSRLTNPHGVQVHDFFKQFALLEQYIARSKQ
jgi:hypothetical protein